MNGNNLSSGQVVFYLEMVLYIGIISINEEKFLCQSQMVRSNKEFLLAHIFQKER